MDRRLQKSGYSALDDQGRVARRDTCVPCKAQKPADARLFYGRLVSDRLAGLLETDIEKYSADSGSKYQALCELPLRESAGVPGHEMRLGPGEGVTAGEIVSG
jgi:hypothetical protein